MQERERRIERHVTALQDEVTTLVPALGHSVMRHPLVKVGGALAAGLVVGLIVGGRRSGRRETEHRVLMAQYVEGVAEEARRRIRRGQDPAEAVRKALDGRAPVIIYETEPASEHMGFFRRTLDIALRSALGFGITAAFNFIQGYLQGGLPPSNTTIAAESAVATAAVSGPSED